MKFVALIGPDYISHAEGAFDHPGNWQVVTSDAGRLVDFLGTNRLLKLSNCSKWKGWLPRKTIGLKKSKDCKTKPRIDSKEGANSGPSKAKGEAEVAQKDLCLRKSRSERPTGMFGGINGKSREYLRGYVSGILKVFPACWTTPHYYQGYLDGVTYLVARNPSALKPSSSIANRSTRMPTKNPEAKRS